MPQVINTNILSLTAQRNLNSTQSALATAMQRLSSGLRINSAKDDAAGLAIATRFTTQINGLNTAVRNANDGISLAQTTGSALAEVTDNLQAIRTLAVQSANATNSDSDRSALDAEVQQRLAEITRIAQQTTFNGRHVLDGSFGAAAFQVGANVGETITVDMQQGTKASQIGAVSSASHDVSTAFPAGYDVAAGDLTIQVGSGAATDVGPGVYTTPTDLAAAINTAFTTAGGTGTLAAVSTDGKEITFTNSSATDAVTFGGANNDLGVTSVATGTAAVAATSGTASATGVSSNVAGLSQDVLHLGAGALTIAGTDITGDFANVAALVTAINTTAVGVTASDDGGALKLVAGTGTVTVAGSEATSWGFGASVDTTGSTASATVAASLNGHTLAAGELTVNGADVGVGSVVTDAASVATLIQGATGMPTGFATASGADISFSNSSATAITVGGAVVGGTDISVAAAAGGSSATSVTATSTGVNDAVTATSTERDFAAGEFTLNGTNIVGKFSSAAELVAGINASSISGVSAYIDGDGTSGVIKIQSQGNLTIGGSGADFTALGFTAGETVANGSLDGADVKSVADANDVINRVDAALTTVSGVRSQLGAIQNRFDSTISNLQAVSENLSASRSRIQDADFAAETALLSRAQILQQAGVSMLAQANVAPQTVLKLLQ